MLIGFVISDPSSERQSVSCRSVQPANEIATFSNQWAIEILSFIIELPVLHKRKFPQDNKLD